MSLNQYFPIAEAISLLLHPHAEVVLHDLKTGCIAGIYHNLSKRKVGDESLLEEVDEHHEFPDVFPVYLKTNWDGKKMKSISTTIRDRKGKPIGLMCINLDLSKWDEVYRYIGSWLNQPIHPQPSALFKEDWREKINTYVSDYLAKAGTTLKLLDKEKKKSLVLALHREGAFQAKHAASYIADVLDLSRATIYNYLKASHD